jgi:hypothetical protein
MDMENPPNNSIKPSQIFFLLIYLLEGVEIGIRKGEG